MSCGMRGWILIGLVLAIASVCGANGADLPAAPESDKADARLSQKVTYEARHKPVKVILVDLSKMTGVTLKAGQSGKDWQVRDRKMNIFAKDLPLSSLMNSIARVMKFRWSKSVKVDPPAYRMYMNRKELAAAQSAKNRVDED